MAHAGTVSLLHVLNKFELLSNQLSIPYPKSQIEYLRRDVNFLASFFEGEDLKPSSISTSLGDEMEKQVIDAIYEAEDIIESHMSTHLLLTFEYGNNSASAEDIIFAEKLQKVVQRFKSIEEKEPKVADDHENIDPAREEQQFPEGNKKFVGREDELMKIKDQLIGISTSELKLVAVVGMIGIGKTTLVNEVYNNTLVGDSFDYQGWVYVGPRNRIREILLSLVKPDPDQELSTEELAICLDKMLSGRRYLIVLDDMRMDILKDLYEFFPNKNNRSRIVVTTRQMDLALRAAKSAEFVHRIRFLNEDESWDLFLYAAIGEEKPCPAQLMKIGKTISQDCQGLPLKTITLGSLLSRMSPDPETWNRFADDREMQNLEMLKVTQDLYHDKLPQHLKACFLYMAAFPQYQQISVSKLFKLWIAEGFLKPGPSKTIEQVAENCLVDILVRNLAMANTVSSIGRFKACSIHSAVWPFYNRAAARNKIFQSMESWKDRASPSHRRFSIHKNVLFALKDIYGSITSISNTRSLLCTGPYHPYPLMRVNFTSFRLLKVLDALSLRFYKFPVEILKLVLLRFLALTLGRGKLPTSVSNLSQLQFLIVRLHSSIKSTGAPCFFPVEIWNMKELRHLQVMGSDLQAPFDVNDVLPNLSTLSDVSTLSCMKGILERTPNLKKLGIRVEVHWGAAATPPLHIFDHLAHLNRLETFKYVVMNPVLAPVLPDSRSTFPLGLKKLTLSGCGFSWDNMKTIARLPNLVVLKLRSQAFRGPEWEANEDKFCSLRFLLLEDLDIEQWRADDTNFPNLEDLAIHHCYKLHEIPSGLGETVILQSVELVDGSPSAVRSAMRLKEKQQRLGNKRLRVPIHYSWIRKT